MAAKLSRVILDQFGHLPHQKPKNIKNMDFVTAGVSNNDLGHVEAHLDGARSVEMLFWTPQNSIPQERAGAKGTSKDQKHDLE